MSRCVRRQRIGHLVVLTAAAVVDIGTVDGIRREAARRRLSEIRVARRQFAVAVGNRAGADTGADAAAGAAKMIAGSMRLAVRIGMKRVTAVALAAERQRARTDDRRSAAAVLVLATRFNARRFQVDIGPSTGLLVCCSK